jgi:hypothetical protein
MLVVAVAAAALVPARFAPRSGWHAGAGAVHACPGVTARRCRQVGSWAATVPWRDCGECLPHRTVARLPPDGIAIQISVARENPLVLRNPLPLPVRVSFAAVVAPFEGLPPRIGVFQTSGRRGRDEVLVTVFFGRSRPTAAQLARAEAELRAAQLP